MRLLSVCTSALLAFIILQSCQQKQIESQPASLVEILFQEKSYALLTSDELDLFLDDYFADAELHIDDAKLTTLLDQSKEEYLAIQASYLRNNKKGSLLIPLRLSNGKYSAACTMMCKPEKGCNTCTLHVDAPCKVQTCDCQEPEGTCASQVVFE